MADTPEAAAREVATRIVCDQLAWAKQLVPRDPVCARVHLAQAITAALLSFRRAALEDAAKVAQRYPDTAQGEFHSSGATCWNASQNIASAIRALAGSTKEGE